MRAREPYRRFIALGVALTLVLPAGPVAEAARRMKRVDQVGTAHVAVLSVGRWEDYVEGLQPNFKLTEEQAQQAVIASTQELQEKLATTLQLGLSVGLAQTAKVSKSESVVDEAGEETTTSTTTRTEGPGELPEAAQLPPGAAALSTAGLSGQVATDAMGRYWASTALYQEIQLLNRYIRDAQSRTGYRPYVVRLQVSLLPHARNLPYDAFTTLSFFAGGDIDANMATTSPRRSEELDAFLKSVPDGLRDLFKTEKVVAVPLLVTDNLEATMHSRTVDTVRQFALALSLLQAGTIAKGSLSRTIEEFESVLGRDFNSLLTMSRLNESTVRARLGAMQQVSTKWAMVPRTHNISLLLLVPCARVGRELSLSYRTDYYQVNGGRRLSPFETDQLDRPLKEIADDLDIDAGCGVTEMRQLYDHAIQSQDKRFEAELGRCVTPAAEAARVKRPLWLSLVDLASSTNQGFANFELPRALNRQRFSADQAALVLDDPSKGATVVMSNGREIRPSDLSALLTLAQKDKGSVTLSSIAVNPVRGGSDFEFVFPSPKKWSIDPVTVDSKLAVTYAAIPGLGYCTDSNDESNNAGNTEGTTQHAVLYRLAEPKKEEIPAQFKLSVSSTEVEVAAPGTKATFVARVEVSKPAPKEIKLALAGAPKVVDIIPGTDGKECTGFKRDRLAREWTMSASCTLEFEIEGVGDGHTLVLSATSKADDPHAAKGIRAYSHPEIKITVKGPKAAAPAVAKK